MDEFDAGLLARLRSNEIDVAAFIREAEKLSALVMQWFTQEQTEGSSGSHAGGDATKR